MSQINKQMPLLYKINLSAFILEARAEIKNNFVRFFEEMRTRKFASEI